MQELSEGLAQALASVRKELEEEKRKCQELESVILVSPHFIHVCILVSVISGSMLCYPMIISYIKGSARAVKGCRGS